jgi:estrogen-related receptor beta like 1
VSLVSWLLSINNVQVTGWNKYDEPITASQNVSKIFEILITSFICIVLELKKLGIELDMPPTKLKSGHGDGVVAVL